MSKIQRLDTGPPRMLVAREPHALDLPLPEYATPGAAGMDLRAAVPSDRALEIPPGQWKLVPTGLRVALPPGYEAQVRPRSGLALKHGIGVLNSPGTIDEDYRGEIGIILFNFGASPFAIRRGDRIAQMIVTRVSQCAVEACETLPETGRGAGGFGHTGK